jgi:hypothetical protein
MTALTTLCLEPPQLCRHPEHATFAILRRAWVETHFPGFQVDVSPLERQHPAGDAPAGDAGKRDDRPECFGKMIEHRFVLMRLEESRSKVVLLQHRDVRPVQDLAGGLGCRTWDRNAGEW